MGGHISEGRGKKPREEPIFLSPLHPAATRPSSNVTSQEAFPGPLTPAHTQTQDPISWQSFPLLCASGTRNLTSVCFMWSFAHRVSSPLGCTSLDRPPLTSIGAGCSIYIS